MKKVLGIILMAVAISMVFVSCDDPIHEHSYSDEWTYDETNHWHECECGEKKDIAAHTFEVVKSGEKIVKKCTVCGYESTEEIKDATVASTADELKTALSGNAKTIYLGADITFTVKVDFKDGLTLDLNGKSLSLANNDTITEDSTSKKVSLDVNEKSLTIKNGTLKSGSGCSYGIVLEKSGKLTIDNVQYTSVARAIKVLKSADNSSLIITNSTIETNGGAFAIQTDATKTESSGVTITIKNSVVKAGKNTNSGDVADDSTALMFNVKGKVTIENSEFYGRRQAAIFRGGDYTVKDSTFESTSTYTNYYNKSDYANSNWGSGNEVPLAAIVIGNRSTDYQYATKVVFEGVNNLTVHETKVRTQLYVYQANTTNTVTVTGANPSWTHNEKMNGASYNGATVN